MTALLADQAVPSDVEALLVQAGVPGACISLVSETGPSLSWSFGAASEHPRRAATLDTVYHLFSGTKLYTATAVMRLTESGKLGLDNDIREFLPEVALSNRITIRHLACHNSGLPETIRALLATHFVGDPRPTTREALARFRIDESATPGRGVAYRNVNYALLGEIIARITEQTYEDFVQDEVLRPLGSNAEFHYTPGLIDHAATGYMPRWSPMRLALRVMMPSTTKRLLGKPRGRLLPLAPFELDAAAIGGLLGTLDDFTPLVQEMLNPDDGVLQSTSKTRMLTVHAKGAAGITSTEGVGLAWKLGRIDGMNFWNHEGGGPGFCTETRLYPKEGLGMVILMNLSQSRRLSLVAHQICEELRRLEPSLR